MLYCVNNVFHRLEKISIKKLDLSTVTVSMMFYNKLQRPTIVIKCIGKKDDVRFYPFRRMADAAIKCRNYSLYLC